MKHLAYSNLKYPQVLLRSTAIACFSIFAISLLDYAIAFGNQPHPPTISLQVGFGAALLAAACLRMQQRLIMLPIALLLLIITHAINQQDFGFLDIAVTALLALSFNFGLRQSSTIEKIKTLASAALIATGGYFLATQLIDSNILSSELLKTSPGKPRFAGLFIFAGIITMLQIINSKLTHIELKPSIIDTLSLIGPVFIYSLLAISSNDARHHAKTLVNATRQEIQTLIQTRKIQILGISTLWSEKNMRSADNQNKHFNSFFAIIPELKSIYILDQQGNKISSFHANNNDQPQITAAVAAAFNATKKQSSPATNHSVKYIISESTSSRRTTATILYLGELKQHIVAIYQLNPWNSTLKNTNTTEIQISVTSSQEPHTQDPYKLSLATEAIALDDGSTLIISASAKGPGKIPAISILLLISSIIMAAIARLGAALYQQEKNHAQQLQAKQQELLSSLAEGEQLRSSAATNEQLYKSLFNESPDIILLSDNSGKIIDANTSAVNLFKYPRARLTGFTVGSLLLAPANNNNSSRLPNVKINNFEIPCFDSNKEKLNLNICHFPIEINGEQFGSFTVARDFSKFREAQHDSLLRLRALDACSNGIVISDARQSHQPIVYVNSAFERITGYGAHEVLGRNCRFLSRGIAETKEREILRNAILRGESAKVVIQNARKDGSLFWNDLKIEPVYDEDHALSHYVGVQTDVTEQRQYITDLSFYATHDRLTALPNRALLEDRLEHSYVTAKRYNQLMAVVFIDLDDFKPINDTFGHAIGDEVLKEVSERLRCQSRNSDTLARLGGDEYILLLSEIHSELQVVTIVERIIDCIDKAFHINDLELHITCSVGISLYTPDIDSSQILLQQADMAMYRAKQNGRNTYSIYTSDLDVAATDNMRLRNDLRTAIQHEQLIIHYQPQIDGRTGRVSGIEALLRWNHPVRGMISPVEFIPLAEANGQIVPIGQWVLEHACAFARELIDAKLCDCPMSINVSPIQMQRQPFDQVVIATLEKFKLPAKYLELEITESILLQDMDRVLKMLKDLHSYGVRMAIDDFGTGFSSLNYLKLLPLNKVKIDKSFINEVIRNPHDAALTKSIISMAHHLSMSVIAEGVENLAQYTFLLNNKCEYFQGYFFSKPLSSTDLIAFLRTNRAGVKLPESSNEAARTLLLVDDEENILRALRRTLRKDNYNILTCTSAQEAFELLALNNVHVIISDQRMPGMTGTEFLKKVKDIYPNTIRMVLSGFTDLKSVTEAINQGAIYKYLTKPWDDNILSESIQQAFKQYDLQLNTIIRLDTDRQ
ncbi:MAG: EAL domain-containing protein [Pseudomonas sp.]|uniref:EAL domain-containing protein n=1 Tax=Pseudomonas sp. TaxID=306 RepID=UPI0027352714|nr:EAL domain-containing protein [Pseudomonas sp.]MDP3847159.1 EAL domain-containing protein [Pseudomonas sp.]